MITKEQARELLMSRINSKDVDNFLNEIYEFAHDQFISATEEINDIYAITDNDGNEYNDEDDEKWYDEYRDDFIKAIFERIQTDFF